MFFIISAGKTWECKQGYRKWEEGGGGLPPQIRSMKNREKARNNKASSRPISPGSLYSTPGRERSARSAREPRVIYGGGNVPSPTARPGRAWDGLWVVPRAAPSRLIGRIHHASASQVPPSSLMCLSKQRGVKEPFHRGKHRAVRGRTRCRC